MRNLIVAIMFALSLSLAGCGNLSPRQDQRIDNQDGQIEELKNIQNGINAEVGKLRQESEITNSTLKDVQTGMVNFQAKLSSNENSGIQILQGDGALILVFAIAVVGMLLFHYRRLYKKNEKAADLLAQQITNKGDPYLDDVVFSAAMHTDVEAEVYHLMTKHQKKKYTS
tara:strand:+ start:28938 stop:29447 length:510 start_codon:yes stop_codon:yes gene_type:complete